jgi:hypothetical protein
MKHDSIPVLSIFAIIFGTIVLFQSTQKTQKTNGCFWDRDTLASEASGFPGITEIITGRFDRFPPLYYEMRLERVSSEIESDPDDLNLYDDAGVACDRLGRHDEAIEWMARKREALDRFASTGADVDKDEYQYLANLGTMHIHRWLGSGANRDDMSDVERSRELIAAAIELNPDAHFGRERYQLLAIEWILNGYTHNNNEWHQPTIGETMAGFTDRRRIFGYDELGYDDAVEGFSGLIALGNAWESIDIFYALSMALKDQEHTSLYLLCQLRIKELIDSGKESLAPEFDHDSYRSTQNFDKYPIYAEIHTDYLESLGNAYFPNARKEANDWTQRRQAYAIERLLRGEHPDTHPSFWTDWKETTSPPQMPGRPSLLVLPIAALSILLIIMILGIRTLIFIVKRLSPKPV